MNVGNFNFIETEIQGVFIIESNKFEDRRGYFQETYHYENFKEAGLDMIFVQDNESKSSKGVLRGLHFQTKYSQGKLIRVLEGEVFDVAVDIRKDSKSFGKWIGATLSSNNKKMLYIPEGFAHGFLVMSEEATISYKCTNFYNKEYESGIIWNDKELNILWPINLVDDVILSDKDIKLQSFKEYRSVL